MVEQNGSDPGFDPGVLDAERSTNGQAPGKRPSQSQLLVGPESSGFFNLAEELLRGDADFSKLLPKGKFNAAEGAALLRLLIDEDQYDDGSIDTRQMVYLKVLFSMSEDGRATDNAIRAHRGGQLWQAGLGGMARGLGFGVGSQQTNGTAQRDGPA